ncbi:MAG: DegT/DnrJ/EryC1/StrS aminotransferase family protein [Pseudomonadota bacterium]
MIGKLRQPLGPWPHYSEEQVELVADVLRSGGVNYWTGSVGRRFESEFAEYHLVSHSIAVANGTLALELALAALDIGPGDDVIVTPRSYFASVSTVVQRGARPIFADVCPDSQNLTPQSIEEALTPATKAILPVHLAGWPCDMQGIMSIADARGIAVIEDCAQAHGARIDGKPIGSFGDCAAFSFCQDKIMTTGGEGGALLIRDQDVFERAWSLKDHGKSRARTLSNDHPVGFRWLHEGIGSNWRLTELQSALASWQLEQLDSWVDARNANADFLRQAFERLACIRIPAPPEGVRHAYYKFYMFVVTEHLAPGWSRDRIITEIGRRGLPGLSGACPEIYNEQAMADYRPSLPLPVAAELGRTSIMLPVHPTLTQENLEDMVGIISEILDDSQAV